MIIDIFEELTVTFHKLVLSVSARVLAVATVLGAGLGAGPGAGFAACLWVWAPASWALEPSTLDALKQPASFEGVLPCADCPGITWHLDLWPKGRYHLQRRYQERARSDNELGRWRVNPADNSLLLYGGREAPLRLAVTDAQTLRLLDLEGRHIDSSLPYELSRLRVFAPAEMSLSLWGGFRYFADAASLQECRTGHRYPILLEGEYLQAERRFLELQKGVGKETSGEQREQQENYRAPMGGELFVHIDASLLNRQVHEGEGPDQSLRIERFVSEVPGLRCERAMSQASLPNTYWRLMRIEGEPVTGLPGATSEAWLNSGSREAHLVLHDAEATVAGSSGCNRFSGGYTVNGDELDFGALLSTRMACPAAQMALETGFYGALERVRRWQVAGQTLELFDDEEKSLLFFEAVYLP